MRNYVALIVLAGTMASISAQQPPPKPFPQPSQPRPSVPGTSAPSQPSPAAPAAAVVFRPLAPGQVPDQATLGVPIYPTAQFLTSYDAGRGQRFYLFGATIPFAEMVSFYRTALKNKGDVLFETPPTHQFETARFRDELMAFPPSVTVKDYTWGGSAGFANPKRGGQPQRFATVVQIVPPPSTP